VLKPLIIATVLLPKLAIAQQSQQLPQPRQPGQLCPVGWVASGNYCVPGSDKAPQAVPKNGWCPFRLARERQHPLMQAVWHHRNSNDCESGRSAVVA
jgi:hypothetical protein